jgi:hypothetical protein
MAENTEKRSTINLITPPDIIEGYDYTFLLVNPSSDTKDQFQNLIDNFDFDINVYLYEEQEELALDWLLNARARADIVILDVDNMQHTLRDIIGYFLGYTNTYWLTRGENIVYNKVSKNKIYNLDWLYDHIQRRTT